MNRNTSTAHTGTERAAGQKPSWSRPAMEIIRLNAAAGSKAGPLCDKHGSLSQGTRC